MIINLSSPAPQFVFDPPLDVAPTFARFGSNVLVAWDETDVAADPYLHAAILLGLGLATRGRTLGDQWPGPSRGEGSTYVHQAH